MSRITLLGRSRRRRRKAGLRSANCAGLKANGKLRKGYRHRKGGLARGCPVKAKG